MDEQTGNSASSEADSKARRPEKDRIRDGRFLRRYGCWLLLLLLALVLFYLILAFFLGRYPFQRDAEYPPEQFFIQDQIVLRGPEQAIDTIVAQISPTVSLTPVEGFQRLRFGDLLPSGLSCPGLPHSALPGQGLVIDLYQIEGEGPEDLAQAIEAVQEAADQLGEDVSAEPNWLTGMPWVAEGSPWVAEGSPWVAEGSGDPTTQAASQNLFTSQWAFTNIDLFAQRPMGDNVRVGIFDTSPFDGIVPDTATAVTVDWVQDPTLLELTVLHPSPAAVPEPSDKPIDVSDHGLFVAGLVHAVAPQSELHLIRVLEKDNRGDVATLNSALFDFIFESTRAEGSLNGTVLNMSLGIRVPPEEAGYGLPGQVVSLQHLMSAARCLDIVVVAASGNNSAGSQPPELANLPAAWSAVIGVAAGNISNERSCFSNQADLGAPGGDGRTSQSEADRCEPRNAECQGDCEFSVVGPVRDSSSTTGFLYWSGSSFAAPMVTGLAAQVLEAGNGRYSAGDVRAIIECGATPTRDPYLGAGVINVRRTIQKCLGLGPNAPLEQQAP